MIIKKFVLICLKRILIKRYIKLPDESAIEEIRRIAEEFKVNDINLNKPGIGEATLADA